MKSSEIRHNNQVEHTYKMLKWFFGLTTVYCLGQEEIPKILDDADDFHGFPETFGHLFVETNDVSGVSFSWRRNGEKITKTTLPPFSSYTSKTLLPSKQYENRKEYAGTYQIVVTAKTGIITGRKVTVAFTCKSASQIVIH